MSCHNSSLGKLFMISCLGVVLSGCSAKSGTVEPVQTNLSWLGSMYGRYISQNGGNSPKSLEDLKKFVSKKVTAERLAALGVANVDELFKSPRDGKPLVLVSHAKLPPPGTSPPPVVLYEAEGKDGQRAVVFMGGITEMVDESRFSQLLPAKP